jgi:hypothetical protein
VRKATVDDFGTDDIDVTQNVEALRPGGDSPYPLSSPIKSPTGPEALRPPTHRPRTWTRTAAGGGLAATGPVTARSALSTGVSATTGSSLEANSAPGGPEVHADFNVRSTELDQPLDRGDLMR